MTSAGDTLASISRRARLSSGAGVVVTAVTETSSSRTPEEGRRAMVAGAGNVKNTTTPTRIESGRIPSRVAARIRARADRLARRLGNVKVAGAAGCAAG